MQILPALCGREVSDLERRMLCLPLRFGGLGIQNPMITADMEYESSSRVSSHLVKVICEQKTEVSFVDRTQVKKAKADGRSEREALFVQEANQIAEALPVEQKILFIAAQEKGASSWLSSLPIKSLGYALNRQEFIDSIRLRYGWQI